jgi:hypothetical protein
VSLRLPILFRRASDRSSPAKAASSSARLAGMSDHAVSDAVEVIEDREKLCGWVVVFGVVLESFPKLIAFLHTPSIPLFREIIGGALVALGVYGELRFASKASKLRDEITRRKDLRIAELNALAERESRARMVIEERIAYRTLTDDQFKTITETLRQFRGQLFRVTSGLPSGETAYVFGLIFKALYAAGWKSLGGNAFFPDKLAAGIKVSVHPNATARTRAAADAIIAGLSINFIAAYRGRDDLEIGGENTVEVFVGTNPNR